MISTAQVAQHKAESVASCKNMKDSFVDLSTRRSGGCFISQPFFLFVAISPPGKQDFYQPDNPGLEIISGSPSLLNLL